ncbi:T9SS type A sorting domain-containing protein [Nonlabens tegetincola]|uniref:T9SS type A sorting domain-containing protein n=1 Tax=Nonlabens tegetincola TaxID=323273 RepID=UPI0030C7EEFA
MRKFLASMILLFSCSLFVAQNLEWQWALRGGGEKTLDPNTGVVDHWRMEHVVDIAVDSQNNYYYLAYQTAINTSIGTNATLEIDTNGDDLILFSTTCDGTFRWSKTFGGSRGSIAGGIAVDSQDNVYVIGTIYVRDGNLSFPTTFDTDFMHDPNVSSNTIGPHNKTMFIIKYNNQGQFQWIQQPQRDQLPSDYLSSALPYLGVTIDSNDHLHFAMILFEGSHFNNNIVIPPIGRLVIFEIDANGNYVNHFLIDIDGVVGSNHVSSYHYDELNQQHYIGYAIPPGNNGLTYTYDGVAGNGFTLMCYDNTGTQLWRHDNDPTKTTCRLSTIITDDQSNIYIAGQTNNINVNTSPATNTGDSFAGYQFDQKGMYDPNGGGTGSGGVAAYVLKLDPQGNLIWGTNTEYNSRQGGQLVLNGNEVVVAGGMVNTNTWGNATFSQGFGTNYFPTVTRIDKNTGVGIETIMVPSPSGELEYATALALDNFNNYVVGGFMRRTNFFTGLSNVTPIVKNGSGRSDYWVARLAQTDCNGVPLSEPDTATTQQILLYPNPAKDQIEISSNSNITQYNLYDQQGKSLLLQNVNETKVSIDISHLSAGLYFIKIETELGNKTEKLIVQ